MGENNWREGGVVLLIIVVIGVLAFAYLSIANASEAEPYREYYNNDQWKNFNDGVEYFDYMYKDGWSNAHGIGIILDGEKINCYRGIGHSGTVTPDCFEIILRHELDRRGL